MSAGSLLGWLARIARWPLLGLIRAYQFLLSPWIGNQCRFYPTCSHYAYEAIERHGALAGTYLAARRLGRCHPWCEGGLDPVPEQAPRLFGRWIAGEPKPPSPTQPPATQPPASDT